MKLIYSTRFLREFKKLADQQRKAVDAAVEEFTATPFSPRLRNHGLKGTLAGLRSISAGYDLRIIFFAHEGRYEIVSLVSVGTHGRAYRAA